MNGVEERVGRRTTAGRPDAYVATDRHGRTVHQRSQPRGDRGAALREAELRHEARAALLGVEAAASGLTHHRLLTAEQLDELSAGLVAEVRRLLALLERRAARPSSFDLREAITPVLTCARAEGLDVRSTVPGHVDVVGQPSSTAQVLLALLSNAQRHAAGSPVDISVSTSADSVALLVQDRGPGVPASLQERVFERHLQALGSEGSGLGLFIARRLMEEQHGTISVMPREGGGSSFVVRFARPPLGPWEQPAAEPGLDGAA